MLIATLAFSSLLSVLCLLQFSISKSLFLNKGMAAPVTTMMTGSAWNRSSIHGGDSKQLQGWEEDRKKGTNPESSATENLLFITTGPRGSTICTIACFHLANCVVECWDVESSTRRHWPCPLPASPPSSTPGKYNFLPHSSPCNFV